jgi:hypothetical protein
MATAATMPTRTNAKAIAKTPAFKRGSAGSLRVLLKRRTCPPSKECRSPRPEHGRRRKHQPISEEWWVPAPLRQRLACNRFDHQFTSLVVVLLTVGLIAALASACAFRIRIGFVPTRDTLRADHRALRCGGRAVERGRNVAAICGLGESLLFLDSFVSTF